MQDGAGEHGAAFDQVLAVVEHQQAGAGAEEIEHTFDGEALTVAAPTESGERLMRDQARIADRGQLHPGDRARIPARELEREPRLAAASRTRERHQSTSRDQRFEVVELTLATDQRGQRGR